jgi:beta-phosphoglucomutase
MQPHCTIDVKAVLFDLDGVITDTVKFHYEAFRLAFKTAGINVKPRDVYCNEGMPALDIGKAILEEYNVKISDEELKRLVREKQELFRKLSSGKARAYEGVPETLAMLREHGVKLALVTGSNKKSVMKVIEEVRLDKAFDAIVTAEDTDRGKPHPDPYLKGMEKLGVEKAQSVVVENAPLGVEAARAAGAGYVIAVTTTLPEKCFTEADDVMPSFVDLEECLSRRLGTQKGPL